MRRRLATVSVVAACLTVVAQPAFAGIMNMG